MRDSRWPVALLLASLVAASAMTGAQRPRQEVNVTLDDRDCPNGPDRFCVTPGNVTLAENSDLILHVENAGRIPHNLTFAPDTPDALAVHGPNATIPANQTERLEIPWPAAETAFEEIDGTNVTLVDPQQGHASLGERMVLEVPSMAQAEEQPTPGPGVWASLAMVGAALVLRARSKR
jgi:hypothetical protein